MAGLSLITKGILQDEQEINIVNDFGLEFNGIVEDISEINGEIANEQEINGVIKCE